MIPVSVLMRSDAYTFFLTFFKIYNILFCLFQDSGLMQQHFKLHRFLKTGKVLYDIGAICAWKIHRFTPFQLIFLSKKKKNRENLQSTDSERFKLTVKILHSPV